MVRLRSFLAATCFSALLTTGVAFAGDISDECKKACEGDAECGGNLQCPDASSKECKDAMKDVQKWCKDHGIKDGKDGGKKKTKKK